MPQITLKQPGQPVADFAVTGATVTVAGMSVDCAARQMDVAVAVEIRRSTTGPSEGGNGAYLAQITIPARRYIPVKSASAENDSVMGQASSLQEAVPLDPNAVQITLWPTA